MTRRKNLLYNESNQPTKGETMSKISDRVKNAISNEKAVGFVMGASVVSVAVLTIVTKSAIDALAKSEGAFVGAMDFIEQKKLIQEYTTYVVEKTSNK